VDNLTHSLVGLTAAKAGLEKFSPGATALCIIAANSPDVDIVVLLFRDRWAFLQHHRGLTHSIAGAAVLAFALPLVFYFGDRIIARIRKRGPQVRFKGLLLASILTTATHPLLDWTNNYGIRLLLPWDPRWFYGDLTFIIDPFIWIVLGGAAFLATSKTRRHVIVWLVIALIPSYLVLFGSPASGVQANVIRIIWIVVMIGLVLPYRRRLGGRDGARIALTALAVVVVYCVGLFGAHALALREAKMQAAAIANSRAEQVLNLAAMPTAANPAGWVCVMETNRATYKFNLSLISGFAGPSNIVRYEKLDGAPAEKVAEATRDRRAQIFLGFARFPVTRVAGEDCATQTLVQFADLRYTEPGSRRGTFSLDVPVDCPISEPRNK
jgi:inner membrane protein